MRSDMAKVVTESPRRGSGAPSLKTAYRLNKDEYDADDHGATRAPVSRHRQHGWDAKEFSDLLGPLRRYLRKQVGRPWDDVYSELSKTLDKRSITGQHIWTHVFQEVERYTYLIDGKIYEHPQWGGWHRVSGFYVHPVTRKLCWTNDKRYPSYHEPVDVTRIKLDAMRHLERMDGIWYLFTYKTERRRLPVSVSARSDNPGVYRCGRCRAQVNVTIEERTGAVHLAEEHWHYEDSIVLDTKHQLNRKELRERKLVNKTIINKPSRRTLARRAA